MYTYSLQHNFNTVNKKIADSVLSRVEEDRAPVGTAPSAFIRPPTTGESTLSAFSLSIEGVTDIVLSDTSGCGGVESEKPKLPNLDGDRQTDKTLDVQDFDLEKCRGCSCSLDSHIPGADFSYSLDTCKQVGRCSSPEHLFNIPSSFPDSLFPVPDSLPNSEIPDSVSSAVPKHEVDTKWESKRDELKEEREKLADVLLEAGRYEESKHVRYCGEDFIAFKADCCGDTVARPMSCGHRLCPSCMRRVSAESAEKVEQLIYYMENPKHWIITFKNMSHIDKETYQKIDKCMKDMIHRKVFVENVVGGFFRVETTENEEDITWHPHIHSVLDAKYIPIEEFKEAWRQVTKIVMGEEAFEIRYRIIDKSGSLLKGKATKYVQSVDEAIREISKYVVKPGKFLEDPKLVNEYLEAVAGQRLLTTFGNCYQSVLFRVPLSLSNVLDMSPSKLEDIPFELKEAFEAKKIELLSTAFVTVMEQGSYWIIINGRDKYRIRDNCNKEESKRKLNVSRMVLADEGESKLPNCKCKRNEWIRQGFVSVDRVFRDTEGYYRLKLIIDSS